MCLKPAFPRVSYFVFSFTLCALSFQSPAKAQLRDLDSHCPFHPPASLEEWQDRADTLRMQLSVATGIYPALDLGDVKSQIYGKVELDGYSVERCVVESLPGFFVTGNLYRPEKMPATKVPGVLCPHGHWPDARFHIDSDESVNQALASGAERFVAGAENAIQARCVQLARMGCIVFQWDLIGYCDSIQISYDRAHRFANQPAEDEVTKEGWLLFSPLAESHSQSILGLQTIAIQRAVDLLLSFEEVDSERIAITGASGGGTQSFMGAALDPRIAVAFPAVMVSTGMQGGCTCESSCLQRIGTGNVEIAALIAPRPLGMTAADDWTRTMPVDGYPELQQLYGLFDAKEKVALFPSLHFPHNYNHVSRTAMYGWMNQHLHLGFDMPVLESDFTPLTKADLSVWDAEHPAPPSGEAFERQLMKKWAGLVDEHLKKLLSGHAEQKQELRENLTNGWRVALGLTTGLNVGGAQTSDSDDAISVTVGEQSYSFSGTGAEPQELVTNPRLAAAYTYGYNLPLFAQRAQQLGRVLVRLRRANPDDKIVVSPPAESAALAIAGVFCAEQISGEQANERPQYEINLPSNVDFRFADIASIRDPNFLPASAKFWDLPGLVAVVKAEIRGASELLKIREKL